MSIRCAVVSEQKILEQLQMRASLTNARDRDVELPREQIAAGSVFVAEKEGSIAGFAALLPRSDGNVELDALFVEPSMRRRGIARSLVNHCCEVAREAGATFVHVVGDPHASEFYIACGFHLVGMAETRFGQGLLMRKPV